MGNERAEIFPMLLREGISCATINASLLAGRVRQHSGDRLTRSLYRLIRLTAIGIQTCNAMLTIGGGRMVGTSDLLSDRQHSLQQVLRLIITALLLINE